MPVRSPPPALFVGLKVDRSLERLFGSRNGIEEAVIGQDLLARIHIRGDTYIGKAVPDGINPTEFENLAQNIRSILIRAGANVKRNCDQIRLFVLPPPPPASAPDAMGATGS